MVRLMLSIVLVAMLGWLHVLCACKFADKHLRVVDEHGKMLRADAKGGVLVCQCDEGNFILRACAGDAG
jgi:hypothetical protein